MAVRVGCSGNITSKQEIDVEDAGKIEEIKKTLKMELPQDCPSGGFYYGFKLKQGHVTDLFLNGRGIKEFPEIVCDFDYLESLEISGNYLEVVLEVKKHPEQLKKINMNRNLIQSLPETIGLMHNLMTLLFFQKVSCSLKPSRN